MSSTSKNLTIGYYRLNGDPQSLVHMVYDGGHCTPVSRDFFGNNIEVSRAKLEAGELLDFKPSPQAIWDMTAGGYQRHPGAVPKEDNTPDAGQRLNLLFEKLFEFGYLTIDPRGYYGAGKTEEAGEWIREHVGGSLASNLARHLVILIDPEYAGGSLEGRSEEWLQWRAQCASLFFAWLKTPGRESWAQFAAADPHFHKPEGFRADAECGVTGWRFLWSFDGVKFRPEYRHCIPKVELTPEELAYHTTENQDGTPAMFGRPIYRKLEDFPHADGHLPALEIELDCPTGNLLFANVLYDVFGEGDIYQFHINTEAGRGAQAKHLASLGAWHVYNGGRSNVFQKGNSIMLGWWDEVVEDPAKAGKWIANPDCPTKQGWKERGSVSGDLRWFYGCDEGTLPENWMESMEHKDERLVRVKVTPGRYRLTNRYEHLKGDEGARCVIERIGDIAAGGSI